MFYSKMACPAVFNSVLSVIAFVRFCRFQCNFFLSRTLLCFLDKLGSEASLEEQHPK